MRRPWWRTSPWWHKDHECWQFGVLGWSLGFYKDDCSQSAAIMTGAGKYTLSFRFPYREKE